jgi:hypothetical protein
LAITFFQAGCATNYESHIDIQASRMLAHVTERAKENSATDPDTTEKVIKILERIDLDDSFKTMEIASFLRMQVDLLLEMNEIRFLIMESKTSIPLMLVRLPGMSAPEKWTEYADSLVAYFVVFKRTKSQEAIPFMIQFLRAFSANELKRHYRTFSPVTHAFEAIRHTTGIGKSSTMASILEHSPRQFLQKTAE